jgi:hypothetical protein
VGWFALIVPNPALSVAGLPNRSLKFYRVGLGHAFSAQPPTPVIAEHACRRWKALRPPAMPV